MALRLNNSSPIVQKLDTDYVFIYVNVTFATVGILTNLFIGPIFLSPTLRSRRQVAYFLLLCVTDLIYCISIVGELVQLLIPNSQLESTDSLCHILTYFINWAATTTPWAILAFSLERFVVVQWPFLGQRFEANLASRVTFSLATIVGVIWIPITILTYYAKDHPYESRPCTMAGLKPAPTDDEDTTILSKVLQAFEICIKFVVPSIGLCICNTGTVIRSSRAKKWHKKNTTVSRLVEQTMVSLVGPSKRPRRRSSLLPDPSQWRDLIGRNIDQVRESFRRRSAQTPRRNNKSNVPDGRNNHELDRVRSSIDMTSHDHEEREPQKIRRVSICQQSTIYYEVDRNHLHPLDSLHVSRSRFSFGGGGSSASTPSFERRNANIIESDIIATMRSRTVSGASTMTNASSRSTTSRSRHVHPTIRITCLSITFIILNTPHFIQQITGSHTFPYPLNQISYLAYNLQFALNTAIYVAFYKPFKAQLRTLNVKLMSFKSYILNTAQ